MKRVTIFCGSSPGNRSAYGEMAREVGKTLAGQKIGLVYGGAQVGLMGAVANGALENGGDVIGVLPRFLSRKEIAHESLTDLILVETMHERKMKMYELSDGFIALPGGFGTLEELFEMLTWGQLGLHAKPVALFNVNGFYDPLLEIVRGMVAEGFLKVAYQDMLIVSNDIEDLLRRMRSYQAPVTGKWITKETT